MLPDSCQQLGDYAPSVKVCDERAPRRRRHLQLVLIDWMLDAHLKLRSGAQAVHHRGVKLKAQEMHG